MNLFNLSASGVAYVFGHAWGTADFNATAVGANVPR
jgi:hypothetical protein